MSLTLKLTIHEDCNCREILSMINTYSLVIQSLINCAIEKKTTTYKELANSVNTIAGEEKLPVVGNQLGRALGVHLDRVNLFCWNNQLPYLTSLVVRSSGADAGLPGNGFWTWMAQHGQCGMDIDSGMKTRLHYEISNRVYRFWDAGVMVDEFGEDHG